MYESKKRLQEIMPQKIKDTAAARRARRRPLAGKSKQRAGLPGIKPKKSFEAQCLGPLFTVTLQPKGGCDVFFKTQENFKDHYAVGKPTEIYTDLFACLSNAMRILKKEQPFNVRPLLGTGVALDTILRTFEREILPRGYSYNIEEGGTSGYHFVIYKEVDTTDSLCCLEIVKVVDKLRKKDPQLLELFFRFLNVFRSKCEIMCWWHEEYPLEWMEQIIQDRTDCEEDEETCNRASECILKYKVGAAHLAEVNIRSSKIVSTEVILKNLAKLNRRGPIVNIIKEGCKFLSAPYSVGKFCYTTNEGYDGGLNYYRQAYIAWDVSDDFFSEFEEFINCEANEGVHPPVIHYPITLEIKKLDFNWLRDGEEWPIHFVNFFMYMNSQIEKL